jgi:hypothetical protein
LAEILNKEENDEASKVIFNQTGIQNSICKSEYYLAMHGKIGNFWWARSLKNITYFNFGNYHDIYYLTHAHACVATMELKKEILWQNYRCDMGACTLCQAGELIFFQ